MARYEDLVPDAVGLDDHVIRAARDHRAAYGGDHSSSSGRVEARGAHVLAGPFALRRASEATSERTGDSRCAVGSHSPSPPASHRAMIAAVRGRVIARGADHVVVETNGIGYKVHVPRQPVRDDV